MTRQKSDLINAERRVWGTLEKRCVECPQPAQPFSCYCQHCEETIYAEEIN